MTDDEPQNSSGSAHGIQP